jgi:formate dehydrogenase major subunit
VLEHWHTGSMTRRSKALHALQPVAFMEMHPDDAAPLGVTHGDQVSVASRRGQVQLEARLTAKMNPGAIFMPFHFREAAANILTIDALDPDGKIPEYKFCAVKVSPA